LIILNNLENNKSLISFGNQKFLKSIEETVIIIPAIKAIIKEKNEV
jgi:hypothetical protein